MNERLATLATIEPYIGKYYSNEYVRRKILRQSDSEIKKLMSKLNRKLKMELYQIQMQLIQLQENHLPQGDLGDVPKNQI